MIIEANFLSQILIQIIDFMLSAFDRVLGPLVALFRILVIIDLLLFFALMAFGHWVNIQAVMTRFLTITAFLSILLIYPQVAIFFMRLFVAFAIEGGGGLISESQLLNPASFFAQGLRLASPIFLSASRITSFLSPVSMATNVFLGLALLLSFAVISIYIAWAVVEFYFRMFMSSILLPFAASNFTRGWAAEAIGAMVSSALRLGALAFIVSFVSFILADIALPEDPTLIQIVTAIIGMIFMAFVVIISPSLMASTISGAPVTSGIGVVSAAAAVGSTALALGSGGISAGAAVATAARGGGRAMASLPFAAAGSTRAASAASNIVRSAVNKGRKVGSGQRLSHRPGQSPAFVSRWKSQFGRTQIHRNNLDLDLD